jgi:hypothetical protein
MQRMITNRSVFERSGGSTDCDNQVTSNTNIDSFGYFKYSNVAFSNNLGSRTTGKSRIRHYKPLSDKEGSSSCWPMPVTVRVGPVVSAAVVALADALVDVAAAACVGSSVATMRQ